MLTVYKILSINSPGIDVIKKIKKIITDFIWDGKKSQIAYETLIQRYENGGLKLQDFEIKNESLKLTWIKKMFTSDNIWVDIASELLHRDVTDVFNANLRSKDLEKLNIKKDWIITSILIAWSKVSFHEPTSIEEILDQSLNFNSWITKKGVPFNLKMENEEIKVIADIFDMETKKFLDFDAVAHSFGKSKMLLYYALINNIPVQWKQMLRDEKTVMRNHKKDLRNIIQDNLKVSSPLYWYLVDKSKRKYDHGKIAWQTELKTQWSDDEWEKIRKYGLQIDQAPKLRMFQYKLLSKKITTNVHRNRWDREISDKCSFCQEKSETVIHLLWECELIKNFWRKLFKWLEYICKIKCNNISLEMIITNQCKGKPNRELLETIILIAKQYIYACKCLGEKVRINVYLEKLHRMYIVNREIVLQKGKQKSFLRKWKPYSTNI